MGLKELISAARTECKQTMVDIGLAVLGCNDLQEYDQSKGLFSLSKADKKFATWLHDMYFEGDTKINELRDLLDAYLLEHPDKNAFIDYLSFDFEKRMWNSGGSFRGKGPKELGILPRAWGELYIYDTPEQLCDVVGWARYNRRNPDSKPRRSILAAA